MNFVTEIESSRPRRSAVGALWPRVESLDRADARAAAAVLSAAFRGYPLLRYMFEGAGEADAARAAQAMFEYLIVSRIARDWPALGCRVGGQLSGVAAVSEPGGEDGSTPELDALFAKASAALGPRAMERYMEYAAACDEGAPAGSYHYLGMLGVLPDRQGYGYGRKLLKAVKAAAEAHPFSEGVTLNTEALRNLPFYQSAGFEVLGARDVGPLQTWTLRWTKR